MISIVVPVYNVEKYLDDCIESIISQRYADLQIILVDDGSTDSSGDICDKYALEDHRISVIHKPNGGVSDARNIGIDNCIGEYIGFVDADDYIEPDMYYVMLRLMNENETDIACCGRYDGEKAIHVSDVKQVFSAHEALREILKGECMDFSCCDKLYRASLFHQPEIRFPTGEINEETVVNPVLVQRAKKIVYTGDALYHYRVRKDSYMHLIYDSSCRIAYDRVFWLKEYIRKNDNELYGYVYNTEYTTLIGLIGTLSANNNLVTKYSDDYNKYCDLFNQDYKAMMRSSCVRPWVKLRAFLTKHHMYNLVKSVVRR